MIGFSVNRNEFSSPSRTFELQKYHSLYKWGFSCDFYHEKTIASEISEIFLILYLDNQSMHLLWCDFFFLSHKENKIGIGKLHMFQFLKLKTIILDVYVFLDFY